MFLHPSKNASHTARYTPLVFLVSVLSRIALIPDELPEVDERELELDALELVDAALVGFFAAGF